MKKKLISIIAPMFNEEDVVGAYVDETTGIMNKMLAYDYEIILVNDGSQDGTPDKMIEIRSRHKKIGFVNLSRNFGLEGAVFAGLKVAKGDAVVVMDADLQDPPSVIVEMVKKWESGFDIVLGKRVDRIYDSFFKKKSADFFYNIIDRFSGKLKLERNVANYRLITRKVLDSIHYINETSKVFRIIVPYVGYRTAVVEYSRDMRYAGITKYNLRSMLNYALESITSLTVVPLRFVGVFGIVIFLLGFLGIAITLTIKNLYNVFSQTVLLSSIATILCGIIVAMMGLLGEYIGQILVETQGRPRFIIDTYLPPCDKRRSGKSDRK